MKYSINLVRALRTDENKQQRHRLRILAISVACFGVLALALFYGLLTVLQMRRAIDNERQNLARVEGEYRKYKETKMTIDKADIELLNELQTNRIYWTKKLATMASHLPDNYWITKFGYEQGVFSVQGYGYIGQQQEQLITLDDYLNELRADSTYHDVFNTTYLNSTVLIDEHTRDKVSFEYSSLGNGGLVK